MRSLAFNVPDCDKSDSTPKDSFAALGGLEAIFKDDFL